MTKIEGLVPQDVAAKMRAIAEAAKTRCADCGTPRPANPEARGEIVCPDCLTLRLANRRAAAASKENHMPNTDINLDAFTDAELGAIGAMLRAEILKQRAARIAQEAPKVEKKRKEKAKKVKAEARAERDERKVLPGFSVGNGCDVPTLDLNDVANLDEEVDATIRSPYNKARFRLESSPALHPPSASEGPGYVPTTYRLIAEEHFRLAKLNAAKQEAKAAEPAKPKKAKVETTVAVIDEDALAVKVKALRKVRPDLSKKEARAILASVS